jgi:hypothetical protein
LPMGNTTTRRQRDSLGELIRIPSGTLDDRRRIGKSLQGNRPSSRGATSGGCGLHRRWRRRHSMTFWNRASPTHRGDCGWLGFWAAALNCRQGAYILTVNQFLSGPPWSDRARNSHRERLTSRSPRRGSGRHLSHGIGIYLGMEMIEKEGQRGTSTWCSNLMGGTKFSVPASKSIWSNVMSVEQRHDQN